MHETTRDHANDETTTEEARRDLVARLAGASRLQMFAAALAVAPSADDAARMAGGTGRPRK